MIQKVQTPTKSVNIAGTVMRWLTFLWLAETGLEVRTPWKVLRSKIPKKVDGCCTDNKHQQSKRRSVTGWSKYQPVSIGRFPPFKSGSSTRWLGTCLLHRNRHPKREKESRGAVCERGYGCVRVHTSHSASWRRGGSTASERSGWRWQSFSTVIRPQTRRWRCNDRSLRIGGVEEDVSPKSSLPTRLWTFWW